VRLVLAGGLFSSRNRLLERALAGAPADPEVRARLVASSEGLAAPAAAQMSGLVPP
jgi:hypothetical protein